jgi:putative acetyltransferase
MIVRDEQRADRAAVRAVVEAAFGQPDEADLVDRLRAAGDSVIALVAEDAGRIVGHVVFSKMKAPFRALGLAPVSVSPDRQKAGIGGRLIRDGLERARGQGWQGVFVLGDPAYYCRFGFDAALAKGFTSPYAGPHLMALALAGPLPASEGRVDYAPAFGELG